MAGVKINQEFYPLQGGLDLMTPAIALDPGKCIDAQNYEPVITGGYRRINGYERYDGHPSPTQASYWILPYTPSTVTPVVGASLTGFTSHATGIILFVGNNVPGEPNPNYLVLGSVVGTFIAGETIS